MEQKMETVEHVGFGVWGCHPQNGELHGKEHGKLSGNWFDARLIGKVWPMVKVWS